MLFDMPAFCTPVGSVDQRLLWRSKVIRSIHWSVQHSNGQHNCCAPNAGPMGPPNAYEEKADPGRHVLYGNSVSQRKLSKKHEIRANMACSICAITLVRIKATTSINAHNTQQQYENIALLTCLEALLGVINACLPVLKPIVSKVRATRIFSSLWAKISTATPPRNIATPQSRQTDHLWRGRKNLRISPPRQIVHKDSLHMFSPGLSTDVRAPSIPLPSFSWRPLSRFYLPRTEWEHDPSDPREDSGSDTTTHVYVGRRPSEGDSPTLPWQTQGRSHQRTTIERW